MKAKITAERSSQVEISITLPGEVLADLRKIAARNKKSPGDLAYTYIIDGLAVDVVDTMAENASDLEAAVRQQPSGSVSGGYSRHAGVMDDLLKELLR